MKKSEEMQDGITWAKRIGPLWLMVGVSTDNAVASFFCIAVAGLWCVIGLLSYLALRSGYTEEQ